ncbi:InlB B-repeat-containing protein [Aminicella lysinilytica]|jgi:hypothetical protein|uniref:List-Bact-rpt repeat protein n=3 Tax=Aminicella lysinilytica TaxID=433323 RepID=A0A4R6PZ62_9FIRM|nr:InlB B-repeat-containing protein [Aminicella lysinilytica]NLD11276.1 InlB B-repeat-containing protein [Clostridiales bacterium]TDP51944.1 List-Bact-rpt repeat protein [Aminicella lysinilytica]
MRIITKRIKQCAVIIMSIAIVIAMSFTMTQSNIYAASRKAPATKITSTKVYNGYQAKVTWKKVKKASSYTVAYTDGRTKKTKTKKVKSNKCIVTCGFNNTCKIKVKVNKKGYRSSSYSKAKTVKTGEDKSFDVIYKANGGVGESHLTSASIYRDSADKKIASYTLSNRTCKFTKEGYEFICWNTKADGSGKRLDEDSKISNTLAPAGGTVILYAQWAKWHVIKYHANGGKELHPANDEENSGSRSLELCIDNSNYTKEGYVVYAWNTKADGTGVQYNNMDLVDTTKLNDTDFDLYAMWTPKNYRIKYNANGGKGVKTNHSYTCSLTSSTYKPAYGITYPHISLKYKTETGKVMGMSGKYWVTPSLYFDSKWNYENITTSGKVTEIHNIKTKNLLYSKDVFGNKLKNKQTLKTPDQYFLYDEAQNLDKNEFSKSGSTFAGWNTKADGSGTSYKDCESVSKLSSKDGGTVRLYAQWKAN